MVRMKCSAVCTIKVAKELIDTKCAYFYIAYIIVTFLSSKFTVSYDIAL